MADILKKGFIDRKGDEPFLIPDGDNDIQWLPPDVDIEQFRNRSHRPTFLRRISHVVAGGLFLFALLQLLTSFGIGPRCNRESWASPFPHESWPRSNGLSYDQLQAIIQETPSSEGIREHQKYYTSGPHLPGTNFSQALWTQKKWQEYGIENTEIPAYDIFLNYPVDHRLALLNKYTEKKTGETATKIAYEATLEEDVLDEDPTSGLANRVPTFHAYSASGNVTAPFVYANFGTYDDFEDLLNANVSLTGKIAIVKYGGIFRGLKVKRAQELGMVGAVLYTDPQEDGEIIEENGYKAYPDGPARNPSAVQRGSAQFLSKSSSRDMIVEVSLLLTTVQRHSSRRPNNPWVCLETWGSSARSVLYDPDDSIPPRLLQRGSSFPQSAQWTRTEGVRIQQVLARR